MSTVGKRTSLLAVTSFLSVLLPGIARAQGAAPPAAKAAITDIQLTFKRDPRMVDPTRGLGLWVDGPNYTGATAQDTVEARAEGMDSEGKSKKISQERNAAEAVIVKISTSQVHRRQ